MYIVKLGGGVWLSRSFKGSLSFTYVEENAEEFSTYEEAVKAANDFCHGWSSYEIICISANNEV